MSSLQHEGTFLYHTQCPKCGSSDANSVYSSGTTFCFACNTYGRLSEDAEGLPFYTPGRKKSLLSLVLEKSPISSTTRGITSETFSKFNYTYGTHNGQKVHIAPYYWKDELVAQHIRTPDKKFSWTGSVEHLELFGQRLWRNSGDYRKRIVVTEGELDCLSISQAFNNKWPVVSIPSGAQSAAKYLKMNLEFLEGYDEVVLAFDSDEPGRKAAKECAILFTPGKVKIAQWSPLKDANDWLKEGKASEIATRIYEAKLFRPDGIVAGTDLWETVLEPPVPGYEIQYPLLNETLLGLRKGELVMFTAGSGIGKSTVVHELGYELMMKHGLKIGTVALEENVKRTAERYMSIYLEKPLHISREGVTEAQLKEAFDATVGSGKMFLYDHWGSLESRHLMSKLRYMVKGLGVDFIILDHISIVVSGLEEAGADERKDIDRLMTNLRSFAEETKVGILAIVHLKRKENGKSFNEGRKVSLSDLRGSAALEQLSDAVIALERNQQGKDPNISTIRVLKNRYTGVTGEADLLEYNPDTGRLLATTAYEFEDETVGEEEEELPF
jgi:twinkle protein